MSRQSVKNKSISPLPQKFYERSTLTVARELLGTVLCRRHAGGVWRAPIVEVEAYTQDDPACHAYRGITPRSATLYGPPGIAYVYFIYGMYHCLNAVTEPDGIAGAVLIRAIGVEGGDGPGKLCRQWGIDRSMNGASLMDAACPLWIERGQAIPDEQVAISSRIGLSVATDRPWRFFIKNHPHVSGGGGSVKAVKPRTRRRSVTNGQSKTAND